MIINSNAHGLWPWVVSRGEPPQYTQIYRIVMEPDEKDLINQKIEYLKAALKISRIRYNGDEPPKGLLKRAHELGHLAGIPKEELENL